MEKVPVETEVPWFLVDVLGACCLVLLLRSLSHSWDMLICANQLQDAGHPRLAINALSEFEIFGYEGHEGRFDRAGT